MPIFSAASPVFEGGGDGPNFSVYFFGQAGQT
jgi:hypothetical protein